MSTNTVKYIGQLIDCTEEEFREFCEDKDLGYISGLHNLMVQTFNEIQNLKDELVALMNTKKRHSKEEKSTLQGLYAELIRVEHRVFILRELIGERQKLSTEESPM